MNSIRTHKVSDDRQQAILEKYMDAIGFDWIFL
jgi:hypothetical protein